MALIRCQECGREISDKAQACPGCGAPVEASRQEDLSRAYPVAASKDGTVVEYDPDTREFRKDGVPFRSLKDLARWRGLTWIRPDVQAAMSKAVDERTPMPSIPPLPQSDTSVSAAQAAVHDDTSAEPAAVATAFLHAATSRDGRPLWYNTDVRGFYLADTPVCIRDVRQLDSPGELVWTRFDVRAVMRKAAKTGLPMGNLPVPKDRPLPIPKEHPLSVPKEHPMLQRTAEFLQSMGTGARRQSAALVCPHCQSAGSVRTKQVIQKRGISGGKATAAVLTGGISLLATGLSRKEPCTEAHCSCCGSTWRY